MKSPGKITIHIEPDTSKLNLKSQMSVFIMLNKKTVFSFLPTCQQKAINMLLHNCKTFSQLFCYIVKHRRSVLHYRKSFPTSAAMELTKNFAYFQTYGLIYFPGGKKATVNPLPCSLFLFYD